MLQHLGAYTIDADGLTHQAMAPGAPTYAPITELFGRFIVTADGTIDRARLGSIVFAVPDALTALEAIVHPVVSNAASQLIARARQPIVVVEAIKLLESQTLMNEVDVVWVVDASPETQLRRMVEKRRMSEDEARKRIFAQRAQAEKLRRASVVITNDGSVEDTWKQVQSAWNTLMPPQPAAPQAAPTQPAQPTAPMAPQPAAPQPAAPQPVRPLAQQPGVQPAQSMSVQPAAPTLVHVPAVPAPSAPAVPAPPAPAVPAPPAPAVPSAPAVQPLRPATGTLIQAAPPMQAPGVQASPSPSVQPLAAPPPARTDQQFGVKRGMPTNAEQIAAFISRVSGRTVGRMDIMLAFGQKSFVLATGADEQLVGVIGWKVENLITRVDELYIDPNAPREQVVRTLIAAIEDNSRELQSEVCFIHLVASTPVDVVQAYLNEGYNFLKMEEVKFPAWREAAREMTADNAQALMKQLRADRVMKPI
jgi:dephospho-CoA kinase